MLVNQIKQGFNQAHSPRILASVFFNCPETSPVLFFSISQYKVMAKTSRMKIRAIFDFRPLKRFPQKLGNQRCNEPCN